MEIFAAAYGLYQKHHAGGKPVRSLGVRAANLLLLDPVQLSLYPDVARLQAQERLEETIDNVRGRFGHFAIQRGIMLTDPQLSALNPVDDHIIHPIGFLT